jgi:cell division transport system ATP-binding protein
MIRLSHVSVTYPNGVQALADVSARIRPGEFVFVVGPTGAGKSTFLKLLTAEVRADAGTLHLADTDLRLLKRSQIPVLRRRLGIVFQDYQLLPDRSVFDNVAFALYVTGAPKRKIRPSVTSVLNQVGLWERRNAPPSELSGGEQQRVCIARALVSQPGILIADEPTGNLDPATSEDIMEILETVSDRGTTVLVATHDKAIVDRLRRRVLTFEGGRLVRDAEEAAYAPVAAIPSEFPEATIVR